MVFEQKNLYKWIEEFPLLHNLINLQPTLWLNPFKKQINQVSKLPVTKQDMMEAEQLWQRFAPYLEKEFVETKQLKGIIESPLKQISTIKNDLEKLYATSIAGDLYLKCDNELPIAGSIKARGGIYEVLYYAERLALDAGLITKDANYAAFSDETFKRLFNQYSIGVGSTGNLGLSIGIISAKMGFNVSVYMSSEAKQWKKELLRTKGVTVYEFPGDFSEAVQAGREKTLANPTGYFIDDEDSKDLFLGYSVAALRLQRQLQERNIQVDHNHPLFVYLPCGVGGAPGGITFGLKQLFGDHVHCFFVEPTHSPSTLIGLLTRKNEKVHVQDFGIDNRTEADGLAVGRPSSFATAISEPLISGIYTVEDEEMFQLLVLLAELEGIYIEPSATPGIKGPWSILKSNYIKHQAIQPENITHIAWATGGALVPETEVELFYKKGKELI